MVFGLDDLIGRLMGELVAFRNLSQVVKNDNHFASGHPPKTVFLEGHFSVLFGRFVKGKMHAARP